MVHLRIVATPGKAARALEVLERSGPVCNIVVLEGAARRPEGDVILCDVPREEASVVIADLRDLGIDEDGSISLHTIDSQISAAARRAEEEAEGSPSDAVVWEEIEETTQESATLSVAFLTFMVLAALIGAVGIYLDSPILIVGAMVVGPEFGPIAGFCVAIIQPPRSLALRSFVALAVGFPLGDRHGRGGGRDLPRHGSHAARLLARAAQPGEDHRVTGLLLVLRGSLRRRSRDAVAEHGEVRRADRRADLRHDDPGGGERRHLRGLRGLVVVSRLARAARGQPRRNPAGRHDDARHPAPGVRAPPPASRARGRTRTGPAARGCRGTGHAIARGKPATP